MTQDEFERAYAQRSGITLQEFRKWLIGLPCDCGQDGCEGWAAISRDPDKIAGHLQTLNRQSANTT